MSEEETLLHVYYQEREGPGMWNGYNYCGQEWTSFHRSGPSKSVPLSFFVIFQNHYEEHQWCQDCINSPRLNMDLLAGLGDEL
jgi:hypothetical protein